MVKRKIIFGTYDTAFNGWTLTGWKLEAAVQKTNYVEKSGGDGSWDLSTALTEGIPRYKNRNLTVTLECSEGNRLSRETKIRDFVNALDGMRVDIKLPDDEHYHLKGRLHIAKNYNDLAHAAVTVTAVCDPWKYANEDTTVTLVASSQEQETALLNNGRRAVVPTLKVEGEGASVLLGYGSATMTMAAGTYQWPDLLLTTGLNPITYSGKGSLTITYREAVLE